LEEIWLQKVNILNLSKDTQTADLWGKLAAELMGFDEPMDSIHIINCPKSPANFAYVNCRNSETADMIVSGINKNVLLDSNLLMAKLKPVTARARSVQCAVKVLIHDIVLEKVSTSTSPNTANWLVLV
jgi:hypothetical protein